MYINDTNNLEQKNYKQLQEDNPNTSLPVDQTNIILEIWFYVHPTASPEYDRYTEKLSNPIPVKTGDQCDQQWAIEPLTIGQIDENVQHAKDYQYEEIGEHSEGLIDEANANPYQGKITTPAKNKTKVNNRINHSSNGKPKNDTDKDRDDALANHTDDIMDADDSARDIIEDMDDAQAIYDMDIPSIVPWPTWNPPT